MPLRRLGSVGLAIPALILCIGVIVWISRLILNGIEHRDDK